MSTEPELKFGVRPAARERKWILCLSGGGYRGLFTAKVLESLEAHLEKPLHEVFDLVAGTSIGSILALGIANGLKAERFVRLFEDRGKDIFPDRTLLDRAKSITQARYPSTELREALETELLSARFVDLKARAVVPAVNLTTGSAHLFRSANGVLPAAQCTLVDAAMASAAAPLYFEPHRIDNVLYADGGLIANLPDVIAAIEAAHVLGWPREYCGLLSIGTGSTMVGEATTDSTWGAAAWLKDKRLLEHLMAAQADMSLQLAGLVLPQRTYRIDHRLSPQQQAVVGLDRADDDATRTLQAMAAAAWTTFQQDNAAVLAELKRLP